MSTERVETNIDYSQRSYPSGSSGVFWSEVFCDSDSDDVWNGGIDHQPILQQVPEYSPKKKPFVTRIKLFSNNDFSERQDQSRTQFSPIVQQSSLRPQKQPRKPRPYFIIIVSTIQICVFIVELAINWFRTGSPITRLSINPFFGPHPVVLIQIGAGFARCMHTIQGITSNTSFDFYSCRNSTTLSYYKCTLEDLCGVHYASHTPNQWFRFITPIFLHAGVIHIGLNLLTQLIFGIKMEKQIGTLRLTFIYFASGIFGLVLGSNFAPDGLARIGCSGSVFGLVAVSHLDLLYNWTEKKHPIRELILILVATTIDLSLGLLPLIDNFSHAGGFSMGLLSTLVILGAPTNLRRGKATEENIRHCNNAYDPRRYRRYFSHRPKSWWMWWVVRFTAFVTVIVLFVVLTINFYKQMFKCSWCKYISCLPIGNWCDLGRLTNNI